MQAFARTAYRKLVFHITLRFCVLCNTCKKIKRTLLVRMLGKLVARMEVAMDRVVAVLKFRVLFHQVV